MDLQDKVAVVTGASAGLGLEFSKALIAKGAHVFGLARSKERLDEIRDVLGDRFVPIECDVTKEDEVQAAFKSVKKANGSARSMRRWGMSKPIATPYLLELSTLARKSGWVRTPMVSGSLPIAFCLRSFRRNLQEIRVSQMSMD